MVRRQRVQVIYFRILLLAGLALCLTHTCGPARADTTTERALRVVCPERVAWAPLFDRVARRYLHHPVHLVALVWRESRCNPKAVSRAGARGLGQLLGRARNGLTNAQLHNPELNLMASARWLAMMEVWCGGMLAGLGAYNTGKCRKGRRYARWVLRAERRIWKGMR
jgi:soluble lytic murein transglycosylase-like protein